MKRMLTTALLMALALGGSLAIPVFGQDQSGQMMQSEKKMGDTMMKKTNDQNMMKHHKKSRRTNKKKKAHKKSMNGNTMKQGTNQM